MNNSIKYSVNDDSSVNSLIEISSDFEFTFEDGTTSKDLGSISSTNTINVTSLLNDTNSGFYISSIEADTIESEETYTNNHIASQILSGISISYGSPSSLSFTINNCPNINNNSGNKYYFKIILTQFISNKSIVLKFNAINFDGNGTYEVYGKYTEFGDPVTWDYTTYTVNCDCSSSSFYIKSYSSHGRIDFSVTTNSNSDEFVFCDSIGGIHPYLYKVNLVWNINYSHIINTELISHYMSKQLTFTQSMGSKELTINFRKRYDSKYRTLIFENSDTKIVYYCFRNLFFEITDTEVDEGFVIGTSWTDVTVNPGQNATCHGYFYQQESTAWNMQVYYKFIGGTTYIEWSPAQNFQFNETLTYDPIFS